MPSSLRPLILFKSSSSLGSFRAKVLHTRVSEKRLSRIAGALSPCALGDAQRALCAARSSAYRFPLLLPRSRALFLRYARDIDSLLCGEGEGQLCERAGHFLVSFINSPDARGGRIVSRYGSALVAGRLLASSYCWCSPAIWCEGAGTWRLGWRKLFLFANCPALREWRM